MGDRGTTEEDSAYYKGKTKTEKGAREIRNTGEKT
jgi:hypothetical protein